MPAGLSVRINDPTNTMVTICFFKRTQCLKSYFPVMKHGTGKRYYLKKKKKKKKEPRHGKQLLGAYSVRFDSLIWLDCAV